MCALQESRLPSGTVLPPETRKRLFPHLSGGYYARDEINPMASKQELEAQERELVWRFFDCRPAGFFVEVGANDPNEFSQTWFLEQKGWQGILIEPQPDCCERLRQARKNSRVVQLACSAPDKRGEAMFHFATGSAFSSLEKHVDDPEVEYERSERVQVVTLDDVLAQAGNPAVDFVSIDTEGTELDVLRGFDLARHRPSLILLEDKVHSLDKHLHLKRVGYKLVRRTSVNNWYVPEERPFAVPFAERLKLFRKMYLGTPWRILKLRLKKKRKGVAPAK